MKVEMTLARFGTLAGAWGGDVRRWPAHEQPAARTAMAFDPEGTDRLLRAARALDDILSASISPAPAYALHERIIRGWPSAPRLAPPWRWLMGVCIGAGLAGAATAGIAAGLIIAPMATTTQPAAGADPIVQASMLLGDSSELADG